MHMHINIFHSSLRANIMLIILALYRPHYSFTVSVAFHYRMIMGITGQQHHYKELALCVFSEMDVFTPLST